jgi:hypothetical protein
MQIMGKHPKVNIPGFYNGGIADGGFTARTITSGPADAGAIAGAVVQGVSKLKIYTSVTDINRVNTSQGANKTKATLQY